MSNWEQFCIVFLFCHELTSDSTSVQKKRDWKSNNWQKQQSIKFTTTSWLWM